MNTAGDKRFLLIQPDTGTLTCRDAIVLIVLAGVSRVPRDYARGLIFHFN